MNPPPDHTGLIMDEALRHRVPEEPELFGPA